jgi:hypothetical protein
VLLDIFCLFGALAVFQSDNVMFGTDPKIGLTSSIFPHTILQELPSTENRKRKQREERQNSRDNLEIQAKKMKNLSNAKLSEAKEDSTVQIPDVDRGRGDPRLVVALVLKITEDGFYQLGCNNGTY